MEGLLPSHFPTERSQKKLNSLITALRQDPLEEGVSQKPKLLSNRLDGGKLQAIQVALRQKRGGGVDKAVMKHPKFSLLKTYSIS